MKKWVEIMMPVMLFATILYFCVFAVLTHRSAQTAAMQPGGTTVVLDAGHGGEDGGATGVSGTSEAALNLDISLRLRDLLRLCGVRVSMIRETDTAVYSDGCRTISEKKVSDIKNRTETVNQTENALLLSVHQNFFTEGKYHGAQVFYAKTPGSQALAEQLQANLALGLEPGNRRQCKKSDGVYLMEHIGCTGVLVECGFLSNYEEEQRLLQPEYQKKLAAVIAGTLSVWLSEEHPNEIQNRFCLQAMRQRNAALAGPVPRLRGMELHRGVRGQKSACREGGRPGRHRACRSEKAQRGDRGAGDPLLHRYAGA